MPTNTHFPALSFELVDLAGDRGVVLKQDVGGASHQVELHEMHVSILARRLGIVTCPKLAAERSTLLRALVRLSGMADDLLASIQATHGLGHEDLEPEILRAQELSTFIGFLCEGFEDQAEPAAAKPVAPQPSHATGDLFAEGGSNG
ncbi:MAG: hypothetical protein DI563_02515 [Variovorax paradoxus]|uniref:Uncharacterized protein n=1 Tax=Variovorax paradoxus TaxID=34073 RepID=A0A2W5QLF5_VARPD|nr:MAG: hypothetical protein DI563_02515 [Variovorax paradoxus]